MRQLVLFPVRPDPDVVARGIALCRAALAAAKERK